MTASSEISWQLDDITMYATFTRPAGEGPFPGVVFVAGSGPTDRDWNSPLLPGTNGSAAALAQVLAEAGIASLRYDKRASGPHVAQNMPELVGTMSMQSHLTELQAAVDALAAQDGVDAARLIGFGNSEGCLHVLHYALSDQALPFLGLVLAAPPGRSIRQLLLSQLSLQLADAPGSEAILAEIETTAQRYSDGAPMDPAPSLPEPIRMVLSSFDVPANLPFARELWNTSGADLLPRINVPTLVVIGLKDVQVLADLDGVPLQTAAADRPTVSFVFPPNANHVLKEDLRTPEEVAAAPGTGYNEPGTRLDPEAVSTILTWLHGVVGRSPSA